MIRGIFLGLFEQVVCGILVVVALGYYGPDRGEKHRGRRTLSIDSGGDYDGALTYLMRYPSVVRVASGPVVTVGTIANNPRTVLTHYRWGGKVANKLNDTMFFLESFHASQELFIT